MSATRDYHVDAVDYATDAGAVHQVRAIQAEADLVMAVDGYPTLADLGPDALRRLS